MPTKYMIVSGFLGSGKTTTMIALARAINARIQGKRPNEQGTKLA